MEAKSFEALMDSVEGYSELMGGLRNSFIAKGFTVEVAENMCLAILMNQGSRTNAEPGRP